MAKVMFFIDGFNVYHSLQTYDLHTKTLPFRKYLWLDFYSLAERFTRKQDNLVGVYYFTAYATWKPHSVKRHRVLIDALRSKGVQVVEGRFKNKDGYCKKCGAKFINKEEKQTDVNIAVYLFKGSSC
jgi:cobalamin biosynthesis Mg chelatase CobN